VSIDLGSNVLRKERHLFMFVSAKASLVETKPSPSKTTRTHILFSLFTAYMYSYCVVYVPHWQNKLWNKLHECADYHAVYTQCFIRIKVKSFSNLNIMHTVLTVETYICTFLQRFLRNIWLHTYIIPHVSMQFYWYTCGTSIFLLHASIGADSPFFRTILYSFLALFRQK